MFLFLITTVQFISGSIIEYFNVDLKEDIFVILFKYVGAMHFLTGDL